MHVVELPLWQRFCVTILVGICIGFVLPPLATHSHYAHKGYSLYNVGFASGIIATVLVSTFKSFGIETEARLIWSSGNDAMLLGLLFVLFAGMSVVAVLWRGKDTLLGYEKLLATTGIGGTDYLLELGGAVTLLNMGLNGLFATFFVLAVGGNLNGPTIGGIFTIVGFSENICGIFSRSWRASALRVPSGRGISRIRRHFWRCSFPRRWRRSPESLEFYAAC